MKASRKRIAVVSILIGGAIAGFLLLTHRAPVTARYERDTQEVVISPGFLYSLEDYDIWDRKQVPINSNEILKPLSNISDEEYRFCRISGDSEEQKLVIFYRNALTGERASVILRVVRLSEGDYVGVFGGPISLIT